MTGVSNHSNSLPLCSSRPGRPPKRASVGLSLAASHLAAATTGHHPQHSLKKHRMDNGDYYENGHLGKCIQPLSLSLFLFIFLFFFFHVCPFVRLVTEAIIQRSIDSGYERANDFSAIRGLSLPPPIVPSRPVPALRDVRISRHAFRHVLSLDNRATFYGDGEDFATTLFHDLAGRPFHATLVPPRLLATRDNGRDIAARCVANAWRRARIPPNFRIKISIFFSPFRKVFQIFLQGTENVKLG